MTRFDPGDIILAPFPHVERTVVVRRPALVLTSFNTDDDSVGMLLWAIMITSAARSTWRGDVVIPDAEGLGLIIPSKVRTAKIATIPAAEAVKVGRMYGDVWADVRGMVLDALGVY